MPRIARVVAAGVPHHITQRGNNRQQVFFSDRDRRSCLTLLRRHAERHGLRVLGWCLMPNHVHLVAIPERFEGGSRDRRFERRFEEVRGTGTVTPQKSL